MYLSFKVIEPTKNEELIAEYISNKSFDDEHFKKMIFEYISKGREVKRKSIDSLIIPKLSMTLTDSQKKNKVKNYLSALSKEKKIICSSYGIWRILDKI